MKIDSIFHNGRIYTMEGEEVVGAVAFGGGYVQAAGDGEEILSMAEAGTEVIDLQGRCAVPGFNDSHMHLIPYARSLAQVDLRNAGSIEELKDTIRSFIARNEVPEGAMVIGNAWNQDYFKEKRYPVKEDLDDISTKHKIVLYRACRHMLAANSLAIEAAGVKADAFVEGGEILRNEDGELTGLFAENAMGLITSRAVLHEADVVGELKGLIKMAERELLKHGVTSVHSDDFYSQGSEVVAAYTELIKENNLSIRINEQCRPDSLEGLDAILALPAPEKDILPHFRLGPVKILADGSLGARTALMRKDYADDPGNKGVFLHTKEELLALVKKAHANGRDVAVHAIGDGAMALVLDCIAEAVEENPERAARHGIIHCQITDISLLERMKALGVLALVQPIFLHSDLHIVEDRVGKERASLSYYFKTMKDMGIHTSFGTDCPIEHFNPIHNIYCAVTRKDLNGKPEGGFLPEQRMSVYEAVHSYTVEPAYASYEEDVKGKLRPGMVGDMAVLSRDIFSIPPDGIKDVQVIMTVAGGEIVYQGHGDN